MHLFLVGKLEQKRLHEELATTKESKSKDEETIKRQRHQLREARSLHERTKAKIDAEQRKVNGTAAELRIAQGELHKQRA